MNAKEQDIKTESRAGGRRAGPPQARPAPSGGSVVRAATSVGAIFK
jgi:hypothetical protein